MKVTVAKLTAEGESVSVEITGKDASEWGTKVAPILALVDARMMDKNQAWVSALRIVDSFPAPYRAAVKALIDGILGQDKRRLEAVPSLIPVADVEPTEIGPEDVTDGAEA